MDIHIVALIVHCIRIELEFGKRWFLWRGDNRSTRRKTSRSREENQQRTQPTYETETGNETRATLVGGECCHHCAIPAPSCDEDIIKENKDIGNPCKNWFNWPLDNGWGTLDSLGNAPILEQGSIWVLMVVNLHESSSSSTCAYASDMSNLEKTATLFSLALKHTQIENINQKRQCTDYILLAFAAIV